MSVSGAVRARRARVGGTALVLAAAALFVALGGLPIGDRTRRALARPTAPARALGSQKLRHALVRAERLALHPPANVPRAEIATPGSAPCDGAELGARALPPGSMPSTITAPLPPAESAAPLLSLWLDPCGLARLEANPEERGSAWEEIGWLSQFEGRRLRHASPVGVRIHGGESRGRRPHSFRVAFRDSLGAVALPASFVAPGLVGGIESLILDANAGSAKDGVRWQFLDALAFDVARRVGADAPLARPVLLSLNGGAPAVYVAIERIGPDWFERRHGHRELELVRGKLDSGAGDETVRERLRQRIDAFPAPLSPAAAGELFDLASLVDGFVAALYCASGDLFQAALVRDRRGRVAGGRWFFVPWDLDQSFRDPKGMTRFGTERDVLAWTLHRRIHDGPLAGRLLRRLLLESGEGRRLVAQRATHALNHELTPEFAAALVARYRALASELAIADTRFLDQLERFFDARPGRIYVELERFLDVGPPHAVEVAAPGGALAIDGVPAALPYRGRYPRGTTVALDVTPAWRPLLLGFRLDGVVHLAPSGRLELEVRADTTIEALFEAGASASYGSRSTG